MAGRETTGAGRKRRGERGRWGRWHRLPRYLWALPNSVLGLALGLLCVGGRRGGRWVDGALEIHGPGVGGLFARLGSDRLVIRSLTLGHVVLARDLSCLQATRRHERVHVAQYERWGPAYLPAYLLASLVAAGRGRDPYLDNRFERRAAEADCGSVARVVQPVQTRLSSRRSKR
jgi:hypothetical protein